MPTKAEREKCRQALEALIIVDEVDEGLDIHALWMEREGTASPSLLAGSDRAYERLVEAGETNPIAREAAEKIGPRQL